MRDDDHGACAVQRRDRFRHFTLGLVVERRRRFVEHQHRRLVVERARDRDALPLATRQTRAALADARVHSVRQLLDELVQLRQRARAREPLLVDERIGDTKGDVAAERVVEQVRILRHVSDQPLPRRARARRAGRRRAGCVRWSAQAAREAG